MYNEDDDKELDIDKGCAMKKDFANMTEEYCVLVNYPELLQRAEELGFNNAILVEKEPDKSDYRALKAAGKCVVIAFHVNSIDDTDRLRNNLKKREIKYKYWDIITDWSADSLDETATLADSVRLFPTKETVDRRLIADGVIHDTDYSNRCGNCSSTMRPTDKYCARCGAKRGSGEFKPFRNPAYVLYGSTTATKYTCSSCGKTWVTDTTFNKNAHFCPECGGRRIRDIESRDFFVLDVDNWEKYMNQEGESES